MLRIRTFGGLWIRGDECPASGAASRPRPLALLALLAEAGAAGLSRDKLMFYLWPESSQERGRSSLRQTLHSLRRDLQSPDLFIAAATVRLNPLVVTSDVCDFTDAWEEGNLRQAADLYRGPFLDGFHVTGAPEFERWADDHRQRFSRQVSEVLKKLAAGALEEGDPTTAVGYLRRLAAMEPLDPAIAMELVRALIAAGDLAGALGHAKAHQALVLEEFGSELEPGIASMVAQVEAGKFGSPGRHSAPEPMDDLPGQAVAAPPRDLGLQPPLEPAPAHSRRRLVPYGLGAILLLVIAGLAFAHFSKPSPALNANLIAVAPYQVLDTSLIEWRETIVDVLSRNLDGAGPLRTVSPRIVMQRWRGRVGKESATDLGRATGARFVIIGTIGRAGPDSVRATAMAVDAATGKALREVDRRQSVTRMGRLTDSLTVAILGILGEHVPIGVFEPSSFGTPSSLEAVKDFLRGEQFYRRSNWDSASVYYRRAVEKDSSFALGLRRLGNTLAWQDLADDSLSSDYLLRAGALNRHLNPLDSLLVHADSLAAGVNASHSELASWRLGRRLFATLWDAVERYPDASEAWFALGEAQYHLGGGPIIGVSDSAALSSFARAIALDSTFGPAYLHAVELGLNVGDTALGLRYLRNYLRVTPIGSAHRGTLAVWRLLNAPPADSAATWKMLGALGVDALISARTILRRWPDPAETAVRASRFLAQRQPPAGSTTPDTALMRQRLAEELAFRGHLHEAAGIAGGRDLRIVAELAFLNALPEDSAHAIFARWLRHRSPHRELALAWWSSRGDTSAIREYLAQADQDAGVATSEDERTRTKYATAAARAHLALARGDTLEALGRFQALPDSLCPTCYLDRLTRARLLSATGRDVRALRDLGEPLHAFLTPIEVVYAAERARVARRLGRIEMSNKERGFVARAWRYGDSELRRQIGGDGPLPWGRPPASGTRTP